MDTALIAKKKEKEKTVKDGFEKEPLPFKFPCPDRKVFSKIAGG